MRIVKSFEDVQIVLRDLLDWKSLLSTKDWDFRKLRIKNASPAVDPNDYVTLSQLGDQVKPVQEQVTNLSITQASPGGGSSSSGTVTNTGSLVAGRLVIGNGGVNITQGALTDETNNNVSTSAHGLAPKLPNDASKFLDGTGSFSTPAGSSGSGGIYPPFTVPVSANFSWTNQLSTVVTDYSNRQAFSLPTNATDPNWRLWINSAALPAHYQITAAISYSTVGSPSYVDFGIFIRDSSGGKFVFFGADTSNGLRRIKFDSVTSVNNVLTLGAINAPTMSFYRIKYDGTNRTFEYSLNGYEYQIQSSESGNSTFITPDQCGMGFANFTGVTYVVTAFHFLIESI